MNKINYENYNDYLLSLNISQICREFGFKKSGTNSMYLITHVLRKYIEKIAIETKNTAENANRIQGNLFYLLFSMEDSQDSLKNYLDTSKIKYEFQRKFFLKKIAHAEEKQRKRNLEKMMKIKGKKKKNQLKLMMIIQKKKIVI